MSVAGPTVLLSSAGRRVHLLEIFRTTLTRWFGGGRVLAADASDLSAAFHRADEGVVVPPIASDEFVPTMLGLCRRHDVRVLVPTIDTELATYAAHRDEFAAVGTVVAVSGPATVEIGMSKVATNAWLTAEGFPAPRQWSVDDVVAGRVGVEFPVITKPDRGSSSIGVSLVADVDALAVATRGGGFVVEERARGAEHTVDVYVDRAGVAHAPVPRRRLEVRAGEVSKGVTVHLPHVEALVASIAERLPDAFACLNVQLFVPDDGEPRVIEINPRFGGGYPLSWQAGVDYPRWLLNEALGLEPSFRSGPSWRSGLVMLRYDDAVFVEPDG